jgi:FkbM family methyltransferase
MSSFPSRCCDFLLVALAIVPGVASCSHTTVAPRDPAPGRDPGAARDEIVSLPAYGPQLMSHAKLQARRTELQEREIEEHKHCPACYIKQVVGPERALKFDAIADCASTFRAGRQDDGGKWLCNPDQITKGTVVYGFGVSGDYSFDRDMAELFGAEVHMFDPGPNEVKRYAGFVQPQKAGEGSITYHPIGIGPVADDPAHAWDLVIDQQKCEVKSLADLAKSLGHTHVDIVKIDIEGGEYAALREVLASGTLHTLGVQQLLVEFHFWDDHKFGEFVELLDALKQQGFKLFRKELNPFDPVRAAEYAFVKTRK